MAYPCGELNSVTVVCEPSQVSNMLKLCQCDEFLPNSPCLGQKMPKFPIDWPFTKRLKTIISASKIDRKSLVGQSLFVTPLIPLLHQLKCNSHDLNRIFMAPNEY